MNNSLNKKLISTIFSFRNEEENLPELLSRITKVYVFHLESKYILKLIFVNDFSSDNSPNLPIEKSKTILIKLLNMSRRFGVGPCVIAGLEFSKGDAVIYVDSDLQDPPELIPELIKKFEPGLTLPIPKEPSDWRGIFSKWASLLLRIKL